MRNTWKKEIRKVKMTNKGGETDRQREGGREREREREREGGRQREREKQRRERMKETEIEEYARE